MAKPLLIPPLPLTHPVFELIDGRFEVKALVDLDPTPGSKLGALAHQIDRDTLGYVIDIYPRPAFALYTYPQDASHPRLKTMHIKAYKHHIELQHRGNLDLTMVYWPTSRSYYNLASHKSHLLELTGRKGDYPANIRKRTIEATKHQLELQHRKETANDHNTNPSTKVP